MKRKSILSLIAMLTATVLLATACSNTTTGTTDTAASDNTTTTSDTSSSNSQSSDSTSSSDTQSVTAGDVSFTDTITEKYTDEDLDSSWSASTATQITLSGTTATVSGSGVTVSGTTVTITEAGTYVVSGTLSKGQILINAADDALVRLVLNGVDITADTNAAIYAATANKLVLILADGTTNTVTDVTSYTYADTENEEPNAAIFSKCDLSINGTGALTVNANFNNGIGTKDDLVIADGNITVTAVNNALRGKDSVTILDGTFYLTTTDGDGIKSNNSTDTDKGWILIKGGTFDISAYNDGIQAETILQINDGTFNITSGGGWPGGSLKSGSHATTNDGVVSATNPTDGSYKGIKANQSIVINGGTFNISAYDDSVHSNGDITINGGTFSMQSGDDGIHSNTTVTINGGTIDIVNSYEGIEGSNINLNSGTISVCATDDGINVSSSSGLLTISGGDIYVNASGDGIDSNGSVLMTGGTVYVDGPTASDNGAIDYADQFALSSGTLVAVTLNGMPEAPSATSTQPSIMLYYTSTQKAGTEISLQSTDGTTLVSYTPEKDYSSVVISVSGMELNATYTIYSNGTKLTDVTLSSSVVTINDSGTAVNGGMGGGQGSMGGQGNKPGSRN